MVSRRTFLLGGAATVAATAVVTLRRDDPLSGLRHRVHGGILIIEREDLRLAAPLDITPGRFDELVIIDSRITFLPEYEGGDWLSAPEFRKVTMCDVETRSALQHIGQSILIDV